MSHGCLGPLGQLYCPVALVAAHPLLGDEAQKLAARKHFLQGHKAAPLSGVQLKAEIIMLLQKASIVHSSLLQQSPFSPAKAPSVPLCLPGLQCRNVSQLTNNKLGANQESFVEFSF